MARQDLHSLKNKVAHSVTHASKDAMRFLPAIIEVVTAFVFLSIALAILDDVDVGLEVSQIFKIAFVFSLCLLSFSSLFRTYHGGKIMNKDLFLKVGLVHILALFLFMPLWKLLTQGIDLSFFPVITTMFVCFSASMGIRFLTEPKGELTLPGF